MLIMTLLPRATLIFFLMHNLETATNAQEMGAIDAGPNSHITKILMKIDDEISASYVNKSFCEAS